MTRRSTRSKQTVLTTTTGTGGSPIQHNQTQHAQQERKEKDVDTTDLRNLDVSIPENIDNDILSTSDLGLPQKRDERPSATILSDGGTKDDVKFLRKALFRAVESYGTNDDDDDDDEMIDDANEQSEHSFPSTSHFLRLFGNDMSSSICNTSSNNINQPLRPSMPIREQRKLLLSTIENNFDKGHARRFFSSLGIMAQHVIDIQHFVPPQDDDDDNNDDNDGQKQITSFVVRKSKVQAKCLNALNFLLHATETVQAYLNGLHSRVHEKLIQNSHLKSVKSQQLSVCKEVYDVALLLHDSLCIFTNLESFSDISGDADMNVAVKAHQKILALCETWWLYNGSHRENLILNVLPILVQAALDGKDDNKTTETTSSQSSLSTNITSTITKTAAIKRLFQIRTAIEALDFNDPGSASFCSLLLRLVSLPACLNIADGRKLLSYLLSVDVTLMQMLYQSIRAQIPNNRPTILKAYSEIFFRAWNDARVLTDDNGGSVHGNDNDDDSSFTISNTSHSNMRVEFEKHVLQDFMYSLIHVSSPAMVKSLMRVLQAFHDAKKDRDVEGMLYRMYSPILWRSLTATNATVRLNAAMLLSEVFPLQHPNHLHTDQAILKGCQSIQDLLCDRDPRVRVAGSECVAKVLSTYWEVIPPAEIRLLLNNLMEHASDTASIAVRVGALNTVTSLLEITATRAVLRPLLPKLGNLVHDRVEKVRAACIRMLLRIKKIPGIKYYHVVPVDHLTARLAVEGRRNPTNSVASLITGLMINSYIPQNLGGDEQINRTIKFLTADPAAARVFYANIFEYLSVHEVTKLAAMILRCIHAQAETAKTRKRPTTTGKGSKRNRVRANDCDDENNSMDLSLSVLADMTEVICVLLESVERDFIDNKECNDFLLKEFSGPMLTNILSYYEDELILMSDNQESESLKDDCGRICTAILRCAGRLPAQIGDGLVSHIELVLASLARRHDSTLEENSKHIHVSGHIALLCLRGLTDEVALSISASIESSFEMDHELIFGSPCNDSKKRKSGGTKKGGRRSACSTTKLPILPSNVALNVLGDILSGSDPSCVAARELLMVSKEACYAIEKSLERGTRHAEKILKADLLYSQSIRESDVSFIISVCECYGRFVLHNVALITGGLEFSVQAETLLHWTTLKVIPTFKLSTESIFMNEPFTDLNISSIAVEQSFVGYSPVVTGPSRRRSNLSRTPIRIIDESGASDTVTSNRERQHEVARFLSEALAVSLLSSSCVVFAEWLAVGGSGAHIIEQASLEWCKVFDFTGTDDGVNIETQLLPSFSRLAVQLFRSGSGLSLLKNLLLKCHDCGNSGIMKNTILTMLSSRPASTMQSHLSEIAECLLVVAYELYQQQEMNIIGLPKTFQVMFGDDSKKSCIGSAFDAVLSNRIASLELAKLAIRNVKTGIEKKDTKLVVVNAKCAWVLCDSSGESKVTKEVIAMIRELHVDEMMGMTAGVENSNDAWSIMREINTAIGKLIIKIGLSS